MRQIKKIATEAIKNYQQSSEQEPRIKQRSTANSKKSDCVNEQDMARAARIWIKLAEIYGHLLISNFGEVPPEIWVRAIKKISDVGIKRAVIRCLERNEKYPPTLSEFIWLSREIKMHRSHRLYQQLPKPKVNKDVVRAELKKIREILK